MIVGNVVNLSENDYLFVLLIDRLTFKETPNFEEIPIDAASTLKWCPNFLSIEEGDALFKHILQELNFEQTEIKMYGKPVKLVRK